MLLSEAEASQMVVEVATLVHRAVDSIVQLVEVRGPTLEEEVHLTAVEVVARPMVRAQVALWRHLLLPVLLQ